MTWSLKLVSDFNVSILGRYLRTAESSEAINVSDTGYGQVFETLQTFEAEPGNTAAAMVWVRAEAISATFRHALAMNVVTADECLAEVDAFADAVLRFASRQTYCFVTAFALPPDHHGYGILDWRPDLGIAHLLARLNLRFADRLRSAQNVFLLDPERWFRGTTSPSVPKMWYAAKVPFSNAVFKQAAADIVAALGAVTGKSRRLLILDLDNTLWGGVIGETGWQGIRLGGHDHIGEAYKSFQEALKALSRRGVQLALVSKNEEQVALAALDQHPEMIVRRTDVAGWRINWQDKAQNILELLAEMRLGPSSVVFLDDSPVERDRVRTALPDILVPEWPDDPCLFVQALDRLRCFDTATVSDEDRGRTQMYSAEQQRRALQSGSLQDWLAQLNTRVTVRKVDAANISRVEQLFNKTNQLNLATRRLSGEEILAWAAGSGHTVLAVSVADKFGDLGLTGVLSVASSGDEAVVVDYILSCRIMGREVEETLIYLAAETARRNGVRWLRADYLPTDRNIPTLRVLRASGLSESAPHRFFWDCAEPYLMPKSVTLEGFEDA